MAERPTTSAASGGLQRVQVIMLDAGGVLLHPNFDWIVARSAELSISVTRDALHLAYYKAIYNVDVEDVGQRGGMAVDNEEIRAFLMINLLVGAGVGTDAATAAAPALARQAARSFPRESDIFHFAMPGLRDKLERLRDAGFLIAVASNNDGALDAQLDNVGVSDLFEVRLDSGIEGVAKPDPELLLRAASALRIEPCDCAYVGDIDRVDGVAARAANMSFTLLDPLAQPRPSNPRIVRDLDALHAVYSPPR